MASVASDAPAQRDVWFARLEPTEGHEQTGARPVIAISVDEFNAGPSGLVLVVPTTTVDRGSSLHVAIAPPEGGLRERSWALPEMIRSISSERLVDRWGTIRPDTLRQVVRRVHLLTRVP